MKTFKHPKFTKSPLIALSIVSSTLETNAKATVNGTTFVFPNNEKFETHQAFADALANSGYELELAPAVGDGGDDAAGDAENAPSGDTFDAKNVLDGNVGDVTSYIEGNAITADDLDALEVAEKADKKRTGVLKAIEAAKAK